RPGRQGLYHIASDFDSSPNTFPYAMDRRYPSPAAAEITMFEALLDSPIAAPDLAVVEQIQAWTRKRFGLEATAAILVAEVRCRVPLCPPLETAVAFWTADGARHQFRLYK